MRNLLLILVLANILYFLWGMFNEKPPQPGVATVSESQLGPAMEVAANSSGEAASVGAVLGSGERSDLAAVVGRSCVTIGPFRTDSEAQGSQSTYEAQGMRAAVRSTQGQVFVGHWVQIRDVADEAAGNAMLRTLHEGGLAESYLLPEEEGILNISLGLFGEMSGAEKTEIQAKSLGLPAEVIPTTRDTTVFFVDIALPPGRGAGAIIERYGEDLVRLRGEATCPRSG